MYIFHTRERGRQQVVVANHDFMHYFESRIWFNNFRKKTTLILAFESVALLRVKSPKYGAFFFILEHLARAAVIGPSLKGAKVACPHLFENLVNIKGPLIFFFFYYHILFLICGGPSPVLKS